MLLKRAIMSSERAILPLFGAIKRGDGAIPGLDRAINITNTKNPPLSTRRGFQICINTFQK